MDEFTSRDENSVDPDQLYINCRLRYTKTLYILRRKQRILFSVLNKMNFPFFKYFLLCWILMIKILLKDSK